MSKRHIIILSRFKHPAGFLWKISCRMSASPFASFPWAWRLLLFLIRIFRKEKPEMHMFGIGDLVWHEGDRYTILSLEIIQKTRDGIPACIATICLESNPSFSQMVNVRDLERLHPDARHKAFLQNMADNDTDTNSCS